MTVGLQMLRQGHQILMNSKFHAERDVLDAARPVEEVNNFGIYFHSAFGKAAAYMLKPVSGN